MVGGEMGGSCRPLRAEHELALGRHRATMTLCNQGSSPAANISQVHAR
jgi:hypothetical protein